MKVFIITEGGKNIGFGHLTRCMALYQAFEEKGIFPEFIVNGDDSVKDLLKTINYQIFNWIVEKSKLFKVVNNADIVIIDSYLAEKSLYDRISEIGRGRIVIIDDYNRLEYAKGIVVNPSIYGDSLNYPQKEDIIYLLGKDYVTLRKEFWNIPEKKINKEVKSILITFGGISYFDLTHKIINYLKDKFDFDFFIADPTKNTLEAKQMLNLMLESDICITGGGQTTYELARVGLPAIGICFFDNQKLNLEHFQRSKFLQYVGWHKNKDLLSNLSEALNKLTPYEERIKRSETGRALVDSKGARKIVSELLDEAVQWKICYCHN